MINFLCLVILVICSLFSAENAIEICSNGVFKCVSATSLQICFRGQLVSSEFVCPYSTYCSETSDTICTNIADYDYTDELNEEKLKPEPNPDLKCTEAGSFPIANTSCMSYYKCIKKGTGFLIKELSCYSGSFDPVSQKCSTSYICPEDCPLDIPQCTSAGKLPIPNTGCKKYVLCKKTVTGWESQVQNCFTGASFNPTIGRCEKYYVCGETTKPDSCATTPFSNGTDTTPTVTDSTTDSTTTEPTTTTTTDSTTPEPTTTTTESTPTDSTTPEPTTTTTETTTTDSTTPEPTTTTTESTTTDCTTPEPTTTTTVTTTTDSTTPEPTTTTTDSTTPEPTTTTTDSTTPEPTTTTTESTTTDSTTPEPTTTTTDSTTLEPTTTTETTTITITDTTTISVPTTTIPVPECTQSGRFPIPNSGCKQYILCIVTSQGFLEQILDCPLNAYFDPVAQRCKTYYICTETSTTSTTTQKTTDSEDLNTTEELYTSTPEPSTIRTTSTLPAEHGNCTEQGEFPVSNTNCTKYRLCIVTTDGFLEQILECTSGTKFDPILKRCNEKYNCSSEENISECVQTIPDCLKEGRFSITGSNCKKYVLCVETSTGIKGKEYECPNEAYFDPENLRCETNYQCTEKLCEPTQNIEVTTDLIPTTSVTPICLLQGRQEIPGTKCRKYLLCVETKQGFVSSVYSCPAGSFFHPIKKRCSESYICEEDLRTCTTLGLFPDPIDTNCKLYYECTEQEINNIQGIQKECGDGYYFDPEIQKCSTNYICQNHLRKRETYLNVISPRFLVNGQCTTVGRYLVELTNCKNYVYCSANTDGTLRATNFTCPTTTVFNQAIQKCTTTASYTCPDSLCVNLPGLISWANPNVKDCSSYIICQPVFNDFGVMIGQTGVIYYCPQGTRYNPMQLFCDPTYVCPTNVNGK